MEAIVNEGCISCGACVDACPEVFSFDDDGVAVGSEFAAELEESAADARDACPVSVIDIKE